LRCCLPNLSADPEQEYWADGIAKISPMALLLFVGCFSDRTTLKFHLQGPEFPM
jgi:hypothetical protein